MFRLKTWSLLASGIVLLSVVQMAPTPKSPYRKDLVLTTPVTVLSTESTTVLHPTTRLPENSSLSAEISTPGGSTATTKPDISEQLNESHNHQGNTSIEPELNYPTRTTHLPDKTGEVKSTPTIGANTSTILPPSTIQVAYPDLPETETNERIPVTTPRVFGSTPTAAQHDIASSTDASDLARDIAELFVANQDYSIIDAMAIDDGDDLNLLTVPGDIESAAVVEELGGELLTTERITTEDEEQASSRETTTSSSGSFSTVITDPIAPDTNNLRVNSPKLTAQHQTDSPNGFSTPPPFSEDVDKLDDAFFDVIIDESTSSTTSNNTEPPEGISKYLEVDSEEFFVPADIKESETTTVRPDEPTTALHSFRQPSVAPDQDTNTRPDHQHPSTINQDTADTIFYISNTEVKVRESQPTPNTNQELQFFPATYEEDVIIDVRRKNSSSWGAVPDKYEEDLIMSKHHTLPRDMLATNVFDELPSNTGGAADENMSISYIGESFIEVKEFSRDAIVTEPPLASSSLNNYVIIQPIAVDAAAAKPASDIPVGVPVIEELPPALIRQYTTSEEDNEIVAPLASFDKQTNSVDTDEFASDRLQSMQQEKMPNLGEYFERPAFGKSLPAKRNSATGLTNASNSTAGNGTALKARPHINRHLRYFCFATVADTTTVILACAATITPLILCTLFAFGLRYYWRRRNINRDPSNGMDATRSTDPLAANTAGDSLHDEVKFDSSDSGLSLSDPKAAQQDTPPSLPPPNTQSALHHQHSHSVPAEITPLHQSSPDEPNGSLITMTMKNNQLIVQTEERHDMPRNARETKVHYSSSDKDGVFVVEVSRGADSMGAINEYDDQSMPSAPLCNGSASPSELMREDLCLLPNEEIQVHQPPPESRSEGSMAPPNETIAAIETISAESGISMLTKTGLSQSNLSIASSCNSNRGYKYGTQQPYTEISNGYPTWSNTVYALPPSEANAGSVDTHGESTPTKPIICAAVLKQDSLDATATAKEDNNVNKDRGANRSPSMMIREEEEHSSIPCKSLLTTNKDEVAESSISTEQPASIPDRPQREPATTEPPLTEVKVIEKHLQTLMTQADHQSPTFFEPTPKPPTTFVAPISSVDAIVAPSHYPIADASDDVPFDSLINLPEPPSLDEIQLLNEITCSENNNMDSLPPPPPLDLDSIEVADGGEGDATK